MAPAGSDLPVSSPLKSRVCTNIKCVKCNKTVRNGILCDKCDRWNHFRCAQVKEDELPDENSEWFCPVCTDAQTMLIEVRDSTTDNDNVATLQKVIQILQNDLATLKEENEKLKMNAAPSENTNYPCMTRLGVELEPTVTQPHTLPESEHQCRGWESVTARKSYKTKFSLTNQLDFPPLSNRFQPLASNKDIDESTEPDFEVNDQKNVKTIAHRPWNKTYDSNRLKSNKTRVLLYADSQGRNVVKNLKENHNVPSTAVMNKSSTIHIYSDSQGRNLRKILEKSNHRVSSFVKPSAKLKDIVPSETVKFEKDDCVVLIGGTNDIACNEAKEYQTALRRKLSDLQQNQVVVFSVPHRHDLPQWSCINEVIRKTNEDTRRVCKYFKNCVYIDIANLGKRHHSKDGIHLNRLGKQYMCDMILRCVDSHITTELTPCRTPIPLSDKPDLFLDP